MIRRLMSLAALIVMMLIWVAPSASAHATVVSTSPGDGQVVPVAPQEVSVRFDEPVQVQFGALRVFSPSGARVDDGSPVHPAGHADTVQVALNPGLGRGTYTASWHVISADSHPVSGAFTFSIGAPSVTSVSQNTLNPAGSTTVGVLYGIARAVAFGGFALLVGAVGFLIYCWPAGAGSRRVRILVGSGWAGLVFASLAVLGLQGPYGAGFGVGRVFDTTVLRTTLGTRFGTALAVRLILLGAAGFGLAALLPRLERASVRTRVVAGAAGAALAVGLAATWAVADHAGVGMQVAAALPIDIAHLVAMAVWLGGLAVLVTGLLGSRAPKVAVVSVAVRRFSTVAACCIGVLVATGSYQAWRQVGTLPALTGTAYGRLLLLKLLGVGLVIGLGYLARVWISHYLPDSAANTRPRPDTTRSVKAPDALALRQLRRSTGLEVAVTICVLGITAMLVNAQPARSAYAAPVSVTKAFDTGGPNGKGSVQVFVDPARTGTDAVHIEVASPSGEPQAVAQLTAAASLPERQLGPLPVNLATTGPGHYIGTVTIPLTGTWQMAVTVRTDAVDETTVAIPVTIH